jgi:hypothetical protein
VVDSAGGGVLVESSASVDLQDCCLSEDGREGSTVSIT